MKTRYFALVLGVVFLAIGILGFFPGLRVVHPDMPPIAVESQYGLLLGLFPVNILHNLVHALFGIWGIVAYRSFGASRLYAGVVAVSYGLLTILGLFPVLNTLFGLVPLYGNDIWLHAAIAIVAAVFASMRAPAAADYRTR